MGFGQFRDDQSEIPNTDVSTVDGHCGAALMLTFRYDVVDYGLRCSVTLNAIVVI